MKVLKQFSLIILALLISCSEVIKKSDITQISILHKDKTHQVIVYHFLLDSIHYTPNALYRKNENKKNILKKNDWNTFLEEFEASDFFNWSEQSSGWQNEPEHYSITCYYSGKALTKQINNAMKSKFNAIKNLTDKYSLSIKKSTDK